MTCEDDGRRYRTPSGFESNLVVDMYFAKGCPSCDKVGLFGVVLDAVHLPIVLNFKQDVDFILHAIVILFDCFTRLCWL